MVLTAAGPNGTNGAQDRSVHERQGPLAGIRVADFCWMGVGSVATRLLGDFGAEVIKIEDRIRIDTPRRLPLYKDEPARNFGEEYLDLDPNKGGLFNNYCRNKLGVTINMRSPKGRALAERLISASSVVSENFAPGVMERWGLTYERLDELSPEVIYARMSGFGHSGPHAEYRSYGPVVQAVSGLSFISGLPGREPSGWGLSYMDNQAAYYNSAALLFAIYRRNITGKGYRDRRLRRRGRSSTWSARSSWTSPSTGTPHGGPTSRLGTGWSGPKPRRTVSTPPPAKTSGSPSPCSTTSNGPASSTPSAVRRGATTHASPPSTTASRTRKCWTVISRSGRGTRDRHEMTELLQAHGIPAGAVQNAQDLNERDPQLAAPRRLFEMDHPVIGPARFEGNPMAFSRTGPDNWRSAPLLGEDNEYVFKGILGIDDAEYDELSADGVI